MAIEGNKGPTKAIVNVCLSEPATSTVTVDYATADGTATDGSPMGEQKDYQPKQGTVRFKAGETCKGITVSVKGDAAVEGPETFEVVLSDAVGATIADGVGTVTIIDDDSLALFR
jgi:hypothetical protein